MEEIWKKWIENARNQNHRNRNEEGLLQTHELTQYSWCICELENRSIQTFQIELQRENKETEQNIQEMGEISKGKPGV